MSIVNELNSISEYGYISFDQLEIDKPYKIVKFSTFISNKFKKAQKSVRVDIENGFVILPERFNTLLEKLEELTSEQLYLIYKGRAEDGKRLKIRFEHVEE